MRAGRGCPSTSGGVTQDEGEAARGAAPRLPVAARTQPLKRCCYYREDTGKSMPKHQSCLRWVHMVTARRWVAAEHRGLRDRRRGS